MDYQAIIDKYYPADNELRRVLLQHSRQVADRALQIAKKHKELPIDIQFLEEAAMLHDLGIFRCDAPSIHCHGTEPYIRHGQIGGELLRAEGYERHARVCERHTGTGLPGFLALNQRLWRKRLSAMQINFIPNRSQKRCAPYWKQPKALKNSVTRASKSSLRGQSASNSKVEIPLISLISSKKREVFGKLFVILQP